MAGCGGLRGPPRRADFAPAPAGPDASQQPRRYPDRAEPAVMGMADGRRHWVRLVDVGGGARFVGGLMRLVRGNPAFRVGHGLGAAMLVPAGVFREPLGAVVAAGPPIGRLTGVLGAVELA